MEQGAQGEERWGGGLGRGFWVSPAPPSHRSHPFHLGTVRSECTDFCPQENSRGGAPPTVCLWACSEPAASPSGGGAQPRGADQAQECHFPLPSRGQESWGLWDPSEMRQLRFPRRPSALCAHPRPPSVAVRVSLRRLGLSSPQPAGDRGLGTQRRPGGRWS